MTTRPRIQRPALGVPNLTTQGDGVSYVSRLIHRVIVDELGEVPVLQMRPRGPGKPTTAEALRYAERIVRTQLVAKPDWWLFTHLGPARLTRKLPGPVRRPYAVFLHGGESWGPELGPGRMEVLRDARVRIANSNYTARRAENTHREIGDVIPCPLALMPEEAESKNAPDVESILAKLTPHAALVVGRMDARDRYKGHDVLLHAWPDVVSRVPDAQLVVVGKGSDASRLQQLAIDLNVANNVLFTGFLDDDALRAVRREACMFAMPSIGEGFGLVYLEAMRDRLPCIASNVDAAGDIIVNGETGFLVDPTDPGQIVSAIVPLFQDAELRNAMGEAGFRRYESDFTYDRFRSRFIDIIAEFFPST